LATLSAAFSDFPPWRSFSASNAHGLCPSEPYSARWSEESFPSSPPLLRFYIRPQRPDAGASAVYPHREAVSLVVSGGLIRIGSDCSPGLVTSWAFPPPNLCERSFCPLTSPPVAFAPKAFRSCVRGTSGFADSAAWLSPSVEGAGPSGLSHRLHPLPLQIR